MQLPPFLRSRKFWALIIGAAVVVLRSYFPGIPLSDEQLTYVALLFIAYILGIGLEDSARAV